MFGRKYEVPLPCDAVVVLKPRWRKWGLWLKDRRSVSYTTGGGDSTSTHLYATDDLLVSITHATTGQAIDVVTPMGHSSTSGFRWVREKAGKFDVPEAGDYRVVATLAQGAETAEPRIVIS